MRITLRLPATLHKALEDRAIQDMRSLNAEIVFLLSQWVQPDQATPQRDPGTTE